MCNEQFIKEIGSFSKQISLVFSFKIIDFDRKVPFSNQCAAVSVQGCSVFSFIDSFDFPSYTYICFFTYFCLRLSSPVHLTSSTVISIFSSENHKISFTLCLTWNFAYGHPTTSNGLLYHLQFHLTTFIFLENFCLDNDKTEKTEPLYSFQFTACFSFLYIEFSFLNKTES